MHTQTSSNVLISLMSLGSTRCDNLENFRNRIYRKQMADSEMDQ